jgi:excisionase family DNA binding protein
MRDAVILTEASPVVFLTEKQAARVLSLSHRTLQAWRRVGFGPAFVRLGRAIRYRREDVLAWANSNRQG